VPAVLAAAEQERLHGQRALLGIAVGVETICRLSLVVPKAVHKAGFHPTAGPTPVWWTVEVLGSGYSV
jgi:2-methylcitrate dehydratase PrpD